MRQNPYDWPHVGGLVVVWLVIAVVAGMGLLALIDPGSIDVLVTGELLRIRRRGAERRRCPSTLRGQGPHGRARGVM